MAYFYFHSIYSKLLGTLIDGSEAMEFYILGTSKVPLGPAADLWQRILLLYSTASTGRPGLLHYGLIFLPVIFTLSKPVFPLSTHPWRLYTPAPTDFLVCYFTSYQHLRSYHDGYCDL